MALATIKIEGAAEISITQMLCICECGNHDSENSSIEFNFREQSVYYTCSKCKKVNAMKFGQTAAPPLPRSRM